MDKKINNYYTDSKKIKVLALLKDARVVELMDKAARIFFENVIKGKSCLPIFTKNTMFKTYVKKICADISFPSVNLNDIDGRLKYSDDMFSLIAQERKKERKKEALYLALTVLMLVLSKSYQECTDIRNNIKNEIEKQRMAGDTLEKLHENFKIVEPLIRNDFEQILKPNMDKKGYPFAIKSSDSIASKIKMAQEKFFKNKGYTDLEACKKAVIDAIRYTVLYSVDVYAESYNESIIKLEKDGYKCIRCRNFWADSGSYKGLNTLFQTPYGYFVEVQFHTPESKKLNEDTHKLYEEVRKPDIPKNKKEELEKQITELAQKIKFEEDLIEKIKKIKDFELSQLVWSLPPT